MRSFVKFAFGAMAFFVAGDAAAVTVFTTDRAAFEASNTITITEDFEGIGVGPGAVAVLSDPIDFSGFTFQSSGGGGIVGLGDGLFGPTQRLAANTFAQVLEIVFPAGITAFGLDLFSNDDSPITLEVFDTSNGLLGSFTVATNGTTPAFLGVTTDTDIGQVIVNDGPSGGIIDNISAGTVAAIPLPGGILLILSAFAGLMVAGRKRLA
ncbi:MAG: hypothetical protein AAGE80_05730 [Pseudomonadota bacterium]